MIRLYFVDSTHMDISLADMGWMHLPYLSIVRRAVTLAEINGRFEEDEEIPLEEEY